jgi:hypothetical protein
LWLFIYLFIYFLNKVNLSKACGWFAWKIIDLSLLNAPWKKTIVLAVTLTHPQRIQQSI